MRARRSSLRFLELAMLGFVVAMAAMPAIAAERPTEAAAAAAADAKMDAALRIVVDHVRTAGTSLAQQPLPVALTHPASPLRLDPPGASGEREASVFLRLKHASDVDDLKARGATILVQRDDLVLARMPIARIESVAGLAAVRSMALSKWWASTLDSSRIRTRVKDVHLGTDLPQAYQGDGVIVGVLDSGLDYKHLDFRSGTTSRLLSLFDFSQGTDGRECSKGSLDSMTCTEVDLPQVLGHGTHVTGIATGNGQRNSKYVGMAPRADMLFVHGIRNASLPGFSDADVVQGVAWMLDKAAARGEPIAINLSLGSQFGAHDGTSVQEKFLDQFSGPGRVIVAAAGNSGGDPVHAGYGTHGSDYDTGVETGLVLTNSVAQVDLWAPAGTGISVGVAAYNPGNLSVPVFVSSAAAPGQVRQVTATSGGTALADILIDARTAVDPNNGARNVYVQITPPLSGSFDPGTLVWSIYTFGGGTLDMWANAGAYFLPNTVTQPIKFIPGNSQKTVGIPATAKRILCVGSHVSKAQWIDVNGATQVQFGATLDVVSGFSSLGPSWDGRVLPNFTAPGEAIISALAVNVHPGDDDVAQGGFYQKLQGTSMAAPHITGIAALMLQRDPALTPENVRDILASTATPAGGLIPNNTYGSGRVDAALALESVPDPLNCTVVLASGIVVPCSDAAGQQLSIMAYPNPVTRGARLSFTMPTRQRIHLALYDIGGRRVRTLRDGEFAPGILSTQWDGADDGGRQLPSGVYFARLVTPGATRSIRLMLAR